MGIENPVHLLFIAAVALIVLGPKRLPELAKALGHGIREFREAINNQQTTVHSQAQPVQPPVQYAPPPEQHVQASAAPAEASGQHRPVADR
jgi:TatA/E family protein of Tat protein translocase